MSFATKVYVVQKADRLGCISPDILAIKFSVSAAHAIAKANAPARVTCVVGDKTEIANGPGQIGYRNDVLLIAKAG